MSGARAAQLAFPFEARPAQDRGDFVVGPANRDAVAWIDRWPEWPAPGLVLAGPPASGKSHLAAVWRRRTGAPVSAAGELARRWGEGIPGPAAAVEDVEPGIDGRALLHFLNRMRESGGRVLLTCRTPPAAMGLAPRDLESRLRAMASAFLHEPDDDLLGRVLAKLFADRGVRVGEAVIVFLLRRMERSFAAAQDLAAGLDAAALAAGRRVTVPFARAWLEETGRAA